MFGSHATATTFIYDYPRPALTVDTVLVTSESHPKVLLIQRDHEPNTGRWALSGGFVNENEPLEAAAERELEEETSFPHSEVGKLVQVSNMVDFHFIILCVLLGRAGLVKNFKINEYSFHFLLRKQCVRYTHTFIILQVKTYGDPGRDPRGWIVGVVYGALVPSALGVKANDDAAGAKWWDIEDLPLPLAIDHEKILVDVFRRLAQEAEASKVKDLKKVLLKAADKVEKQLR